MKIPDGTFAESSLIWFIWELNGKLSGYVVPREMKDQFANTLPMILAATHKELPAPTLEEIMAALNDCGNVFLRKDDDGWMIMRELPGDDEGYGYEVTTERAPDNPATAALRLWAGNLQKGNGK